MASIKEPIQDLLALLGSIPVVNGDGNTVSLHARMWNNHIQRMREKQMEAFPLPACFIEFVSFAQLESIGGGVVAGDLTIKLHVVHEFYDAQDGTMGQDLAIFDLKDQINRKLCNGTVSLTGCSTPTRVAESSSNDFDNVHEYILEYRFHFMDEVNSQYDPANNRFILFNLPQPTDLELTIQPENAL